mmetsp:Transcript_6715/g.10626  ORF Transcript_6715/g.10626 Transcript_6715/m.10626 type:complete len:84 (+) Transcript_6715:1809-2060(+)
MSTNLTSAARTPQQTYRLDAVLLDSNLEMGRCCGTRLKYHTETPVSGFYEYGLQIYKLSFNCLSLCVLLPRKRFRNAILPTIP